LAKLSRPSTEDVQLVEDFLAAVKGMDDLPAGRLVGLSDEWVRQRRAGHPFEKLKGPTRRKIEEFLATVGAGDAQPPAGQCAGAAAMHVRETPPAPSFVEHVLFTAGRIAELANQIAHAAEKQLAVSQELGQRSQTELSKRAPVAHHRPAKPPAGPKDSTSRGEA
jgi:hypothetical protein